MKRNVRILIMMSIFATLFLSGCTNAGIECGLIGKWENEPYPYYYEIFPDYGIIEIIYTFEIRRDDKIAYRIKVKDSNEQIIADREFEFTVKSVSNHCIKYDYDGCDYEIEYQNLICDTVEFKFDSYWKTFSFSVGEEGEDGYFECSITNDSWLRFTRVF